MQLKNLGYDSQSTNLGWHLAEDVVSSVLLRHAVFQKVCIRHGQERLLHFFCALLTSRYNIQLMPISVPKIDVCLMLRQKEGQRQSPLE